MNTPRLFLTALFLTTALHAQVPRLINYQGRVAVGAVNFDGTGQFRFALVDSAATTTFWSNDGSSVAGSQPVTAVSLPVDKGLYSVLLGDPSLGNMTALPASVFTHPDVRLRVWFNDGVNGSQLLTPDQRLAPAAYLADGVVTATTIADAAIGGAKIAPGAIAGSHVAPASLDFSRLLVPSAPTTGQVLGFDGASLKWNAPVAGGDSLFSLNGTSAYYLGGNVGVGTSTPTHRLTLAGGPAWTSSFWLGSIGLPNGSAIGWVANTNGQRFGIGHTNGGFHVFRTASDLGTTGNSPSYDLTITDTGNVGIGTTAPTSKLEIVAQDAIRASGYQPVITIADLSTPGVVARSAIQGVGGDLNLFTESYLSGANGFAFLKLANNGNVGIGSTNPVGRLEVVGQDAVRLIGYQPVLTFYDTSAGYAAGRIQSAGGDIAFEPQSFITGADGNSYAKLFNSGNFSVKTLTIRGGADLAEPFEFSDDKVQKGAVMIIDPHQPGKLKLSHRAYDRRVAGVVSGANGVNPGISLHQDGLVDGGQNVALTGRVYVQADASYGAIEPGDQLTTSETPGHAMKVLDHVQAQGAILGKAMSALPEGRGMVLVLVTLQ